MHEILGRGETPREKAPPSVPVGPSSPRPTLAVPASKRWGEDVASAA